MKSKVWSYLTFLATGIALGIVIGAKYIAGDDYSIEIKKIKGKKGSGTIDVDINAEVNKPEKKKKRRLFKNKNKDL